MAARGSTSWRDVPSFVVLGVVIFVGGCSAAFGGTGTRAVVLVLGADGVAVFVLAAVAGRTALGRSPLITTVGTLLLVVAIPVLSVGLGCYADTHSLVWALVAGLATFFAIDLAVYMLRHHTTDRPAYDQAGQR